MLLLILTDGSDSGGAVKIDLSSADKSIRRPGSAPDLADPAKRQIKSGLKQQRSLDRGDIGRRKSR